MSRTFLYSWVGVVAAANVGYSIVYRPLAAAPNPAIVVDPKVPAPRPPAEQQ